ncbi:hypothetical protein F444_01074 [Phytophthora nicotianae P1976]|uniref:Uncharacterized protein n=1 Tax=Phytophthora nicotianae P1976 TaxID=1317066 RepID=A0A081B1T8_PHYNI|nr:hypothetical protein F444_01074 [Phytophthora nicotianae P1976]
MSDNGWSDLVIESPYDYLMEPYESRPGGSMTEYYPNLYFGEWGPTPKAMEAAATPSGSFFYFMQLEF